MKRQTGTGINEQLEVTGSGGSGGTVDQGNPGTSPWLVNAAKATAADPSYSEGDEVYLSTDLDGNLRVLATIDTTGLATSAKQDTGNASLASIDTKLTSPLTVQSTNLDIRDLVFATDKVDVSGSSSVGVTGPLTDTQLRASAVPISAASLPLPTGAATAALQTQPGVDIGDVTINNGAGAAAVNIQDGGNSITVDAASLPLPTLASTSTKQSDGSQKTQIVDGSGNVIGSTSNALDINIKSGNPTTIAVTNTGTFAVQDAAAEASLSVLDDWDESDRAKVNLIVGQAGITGAAGAVAANTPRVTLASDDPAVAVLGTTSGAAVITDANGTIQQYLRGLVKLAITAGSFLVTATIAAGTNLIGIVSASNETSTVYNGTTALTPKFQKIAVSSSGNNALVTAVSAKKIRVLGYNFMANGTVNAKFQSDGAGTPVDLTGLKYCVANTGISVSYNPVGWFESASGKSLDINLSAGVAIGGELVYIEV